METLLQDIRFAARSLTKAKGFAAVVLVTLMLGIGANTAIFSVVNAVLLQPLPYRNPDRLVMLWQDWRARSGPEREWFNFPDFADWRSQNTTLEDMTVVMGNSMALTGSGEPERLAGSMVSESFFRVLGSEPRLGRGFGPTDFETSARVVVLSDALWTRRFSADPKIVGQAITLNGEPFTVIGIMPPEFRPPLSPRAAFWRMIRLDQTTSGCLGSRTCVVMQAIGRLKPTVTIDRALSDLGTVAARLAQQYPESNRGRGASVVSLRTQLTGDTRQALLTLLGAVGFVLLIACANIANLLLARGAAREREVAIRTALGAARSRLVRQLMTESIMLAAVGAALGLLVAVWGVDLLKAMIPPELTSLYDIRISMPVLIFTAVLALFAGILFGLAPAIQGTRANLTESFKDGGRTTTGSLATRRLRGSLVATEMAVALTLLIGSALMMKSFLRLQSVDLGFDPRNVLQGTIQIPSRSYPNDTAVVAFYDQLVTRLKRYPQVEAAAVSTVMPLSGNNTDMTFQVEGTPILKDGDAADLWTRNVTPDYHAAMRIPLRRGRVFTAADQMGAPGVAVVNELTAKRLWPGQDPIGKRITPFRAPPDFGWITIVGVVADVRHDGVEIPPRMEIYFPHAQMPASAMMFAIRAKSNPEQLAALLRSEVMQMDPNVPITNPATYETLLRESLSLPRLYMSLFGVFATVALVLAAVGIYGVIAYNVAQRTHEIGVRMALGARREDVVRMILREGGALCATGIVAGMVVAFTIRKVMETLVFDVSTRDPMTFIGVPVVLAVVALLATLIPARRATRVEPSVALRYE